MQRSLTCGRVATLRLQPVHPLCNDAIKRYRQSESNDRGYSIMVTEDPSSHVHAWIDNELFIDALNILFKDLLSCTELVKNITIGLKQIGLSTCRIIIGHSEIPDLSKCDGPYQLSSCPSYEYNIKNSQTIISMHGGYIQAWKTPDVSKCFFEINLICMSGNEGDENDRI